MLYYSSKLKQVRGQSLIEILFAMSLAVLAISTIAYLFLQTQVSTRHSVEQLHAQALAQEGLSAVSSISQQSFNNLTAGTHGIEIDEGQWTLSGIQDISGKYIRTVELTLVDPGLYAVVSTVTWDLSSVRSNTVSYTIYISNWEQTAGDATDVHFDADGSFYTFSGTTLEGVTVANTHPSENYTIEQIRLQWDGSSTLDVINIGGVTVFDAATTTPVLSGDLVDISDVTINAGGIASVFGPLVFTSSMLGTDVLVTTYLGDGSKRSMRISP